MMLAAPTLHWRELPPLPIPQGGGAIAFSQGKLIVAGGSRWQDGKKSHLTDVQIYDPGADKWSAGAPLPYALGYGPSFEIGGKITVVGGFDGDKFRPGILEYDVAKNTWRQAGEAPAPTILGRAAVWQGTPYLFGGCPTVADLAGCHDGVYSRDKAGKWQEIAKLPGGKISLFGIAAVRNEIFLFGGSRITAAGALENLAAIHAFDPKKKTWRAVSQLPEAVRGIAAVANGTQSILLLGGYGTSFRNTVENFDVPTGRMTTLAPLPLAVMTDFAIGGGQIFGAGGEDAMKSRTARAFGAALEQ